MLGGILLCQLFLLFLARVGLVAQSFLFTDAEETALSGFMTADLLLLLFVCTDGACRVRHNFLHVSFFPVHCEPVRGQTLNVALSNVVRENLCLYTSRHQCIHTEPVISQLA